MIERCGGCHWWQQQESWVITGWGACGLISQDASIEGDGASISKIASAVGRDPGEGSLLTLASFGCVEFEPISHPSAWVGEDAPS